MSIKLLIIFMLYIWAGFSYQSACKIRSNFCHCESSENVEQKLANLLKFCCQPGILKFSLKNIFIGQITEDSFIQSPCHQLEEIRFNYTQQLITSEELPFLTKNSFLGLPNIKSLAIENNPDLKTFKKGVFSNLGASLVELSLANNRISVLTGEEFDGFSPKASRLKSLDLSHNKIENLDSARLFGQFKYENIPAPLQTLDLSYNRLASIRQEMFPGLDNLQELLILENPLEIVYGGSFKNLRNLKTLSMSGNFKPKKKGGDVVILTQAMLHGLVQLKSLRLSNLGIESIQENAFLEIDLRRLDLSYNQIREVPSVVLDRLGGIMGRQLEELNLSNNEISCINDNPFKYLNRLKVLDLSFNNLRIINDKTLYGLENLHRLILTGNNLVRIAPYSFNHFNRLGELHLNVLMKRELKIVREAFLKSALGILSNRTRIIGLENMGIQHGGNSRYLDDFSSLESFDCAVEELLLAEEMEKEQPEYLLSDGLAGTESMDLYAFLRENKKILIMTVIMTLVIILLLLLVLMVYRCCCQGSRRIKKRSEMRSRLFSDNSSNGHIKSSILTPDSLHNSFNNFNKNSVNSINKNGYNSARSFSPTSGGLCNETTDSNKFLSLFSQTNCIGKLPVTSNMNSCNSSVNQASNTPSNHSKYREADILNNLQIAPPPYPQHSRSPFFSHDQTNLLQNIENLSTGSGTLLSNNKVSSLVGSTSGVRVLSSTGSTERTNTTPCTNSSLDGGGHLGVIIQPTSPNSINNEFINGGHFDAFNSFGLV